MIEVPFEFRFVLDEDPDRPALGCAHLLEVGMLHYLVASNGYTLLADQTTVTIEADRFALARGAGTQAVPVNEGALGGDWVRDADRLRDHMGRILGGCIPHLQPARFVGAEMPRGAELRRLIEALPADYLAIMRLQEGQEEASLLGFVPLATGLGWLPEDAIPFSARNLLPALAFVRNTTQAARVGHQVAFASRDLRRVAVVSPLLHTVIK